MVTRPLLNKLLRFVREDTLSLFRFPQEPEPDLYTYPFIDRNGYHRKLHLRVESDRQGVLFVDLTHPLNLNQTATQIAKWALEGIAENRARKFLQLRFGAN